MKVLIIACLIFAVGLQQVEPRSVDIQQSPEVLKETADQLFQCGLELGPKALIDKHDQLYGCIWVKKGILNENGDVFPNKLEKYLIKSFSGTSPITDRKVALAREITDLCKDIQAETYGQKATKIQDCIKDTLRNKLHVLGLL